MTICVIEGLTTGTDVWSPILVGNRSNARGGVRFQAREQRVDKGKKEELAKSHFRVLNFNKDGGVSHSNADMEIIHYGSVAPILHKLARAYDVEKESAHWRAHYYDRMSFRAKTFESVSALNDYLVAHGISPVVSPIGDEKVEVIVEVDGTKTAAELYQEIGRLIATDATAASKTIVTKPTTSDVVLTDQQIVDQQANIVKASIKNVLAILQKNLTKQANDHIQRVYRELNDGKGKVPAVEVTVTKV